MKGDGQESHAKNIAALGKINTIILKGVNPDLLADCSKDGKMSEIREAICVISWNISRRTPETSLVLDVSV